MSKTDPDSGKIKTDKSRLKAEKKAIYKEKTDEIIREVMENQPESEPESLQKPKGTSNKILKRLGILLFVALNVVVIYFTAAKEFSGNPSERPDIGTFDFTRVLFLLGGILCLVVVLASETIKYIIMMKHLGEKVSVRHAFAVAALGKYYDCITPSGAGGQPFQIYYLHSNGYSSGACSAMPLSGFVTMQFGFVFLCLMAFIFGNSAIDAAGKPGIKALAYVGAIAYTVVPLMIIISGIAPKIAMRIVAGFVRVGARLHIVKNPNHAIMKSIRSLHSYSTNLRRISKSKALIVKLMLLSILFQTAMCSMPFFAVHMFGGDIAFFDALFICVFVQASVTLVPTPGNSGAAEGSFYLVFSSLGDHASTFWPMLVWRFLCYYSFIIIGALIYAYNAVLKLIKKRKQKKLVTDEAE